MQATLELPTGGSGTDAVSVEINGTGLRVTVTTGGGYGVPATVAEYVSIPMLTVLVQALWLSRNSMPPQPDGTGAVMDALIGIRGAYARRPAATVDDLFEVLRGDPWQRRTWWQQ
jgi:hypothetical protein